jgi:hypothetical protein
VSGGDAGGDARGEGEEGGQGESEGVQGVGWGAEVPAELRVSVVWLVDKGDAVAVEKLVRSVLQSLSGSWPVDRFFLVACSASIASHLVRSLPRLLGQPASGEAGGARARGVHGGGAFGSAEGAGWLPEIQVVAPEERIELVEAGDVGFSVTDTPFVLFFCEGVEVVERGQWLAESVGLMKGMPHLAAVTLLEHSHLLTPLRRAERSVAKHAFFRFATSWRTADAGLSLAAALWRRAAYVDALQGTNGREEREARGGHAAQAGTSGGGWGGGVGLRWFGSMEDMNVFLRLTGYQVVALTKGWATYIHRI